MRAPRRLIGSLLAFLFVALLLLAVGPLVASGLLGAWLIDGHSREDLSRTVALATNSAANEIARYAAAPEEAVETVARRLGAGAAPAALADLLAAYRLDSLGILALVILDADRRAVAASPSLYAGDDYSRRSFLADADGEAGLSRPFVDARTGQVIAAAWRRSGGFLAVAFLQLDAIARFLQPLRYFPADDLAVVDATGAFIAHTDPRFVQERRTEPRAAELAALAPGALARFAVDGSPYYCAGAAVTGTPWRVVYYRDAASADRTLAGFIDRYLAMLTLVAALASLFAIPARLAVSRRFAGLASRIERIRAGDWSGGDAAAPEPWREFRAIDEAFSAMAAELSARQDQLRRSEESYRGLFERQAAPALIIDPDSGRIVDANPAAAAFYGWPRPELAGMDLRDVTSLRNDDFAQAMRDAATGRRTRFQVSHRRADGSVRDVEVYSGPVDWDGALRLFSIVFDLTERRMAERAVERSLAEMDALLHELQHRVKNNLQVMISLMNLQIDGLAGPNGTDPGALPHLRDNRDRIQALASLHDILYDQPGLSEIALAEYFNRVIDQQAEALAELGVRLEKNWDTVLADPDTALPLGLILNELLSNVRKHAYPPERRREGPSVGRVALRWRGNLSELTVSDDGVGLPPALRPETAETLGFALVRGLAAQIGGSVRFEASAAGTAATVIFPSPSPAAD
jgi:PAS domain S-box-containing protein